MYGFTFGCDLQSLAKLDSCCKASIVNGGGGGLGFVLALPAFFPGTSLESICFDLSSEVLLSTFDISLLFSGPCQTSEQGITQGSSLSHEEQRDSVVH